MIPYDVDPTLHSDEPQEPKLDDGCTRPAAAPEPCGNAGERQPAGTILPDKSDF